MNLNQVTIPTLDLEKGIAFYEKLGLQLIVKSAPRYARFECPDGKATLSLHLVDALPVGSGTILYFELENLDEKVKELIAMDIAFEHEPVDQSWLWREARLSDPDGNVIKLYNAGENRRFPPWRIED